MPTLSGSKEDNKPVYFKGLGMASWLGDSSGLNAVGQNYENDWILILSPTWKVGRVYFDDIPALKGLTVSGRWLLSGEFTGVNDAYRTGQIAPTANYNGCDSSAPGGQGGVVNTSNVPYCQSGAQRRLDYGDIVLKVSDKVYTIPVLGIDLTPGVASSLPISAQSQYAKLITTLQGSIGVSRNFFNDKLQLSYGFAATKIFHSKNVDVVGFSSDPLSDPNNPQLNTPTGTSTSTDLERFADGTLGMVSSYSLIHTFSVSYNITDKVTASASYLIRDTFKEPIPNCDTYLGAGVGTVNACTNSNAVAQSQGATLLQRGDKGGQLVRAGVEYQINDYLSADVGLYSESPQRHPNGSWQQPILTTDYNNYSSVSIGVTLIPEALAATIVHPS